MKTYIFKAEKENNSQFKGIKDIGPIRKINKEPLLVFIFQEEEKDLANDVYKALIGFKYPFFFPGMKEMFGVNIKKKNVTKININSFSKIELTNAALELEKLENINNEKIIIGIFIEHLKYDEVYTNFSPYYYLKYICTIKKIPLQAITIEQIKKKDGLKWAASGIGLQIFAKLGGIPWKVKSDNEKCIIIGIGSAHVLNKLTNEIEKYFAYSVCIDSSGIYKKIDVLSNTKDKTVYMQQLKKNIKKVILEYLEENIDKCVIHLPFKIKQDEIRSIRESVKLINSKFNKVKFIFIKINTKNKFFGYANNNSKVPYESTYIKLSKNEYLVWFEGLQFGKENVYKSVGNPVHIQFIEDYSLDDKEKKLYLQDIINLSGANWRGFNAKLLPISIYYPEIIAKYISEFRKYNQNEIMDISNIKIPWFL
jgi:vacuolar-type H+-ATPase subunit F/Vma7